MKTRWFGSWFALLAIVAPPAQAQYYPPVTAPYRNPVFPYTGPPGTGTAYPFGGTYGYGGGPYGGGLYGGGLYGGAPYGMGAFGNPYGALPYGTGTYGTATWGGGGGVAGTAAPALSTSLTDPTVTGHPTRFMNYSRYFFNQGGNVNTPLPGTRAVLGTNPTATTPGIGAAPPRGNKNTTTNR